MVQAKARETILSAGGVASPQILELSASVGPSSEAARHRGEASSKGGGENFRDHINARIIWKVKDPRVS